MKITEEYLDKYVTHLKVVFSEWEMVNAEWLEKTEKEINKMFGKKRECGQISAVPVSCVKFYFYKNSGVFI